MLKIFEQLNEAQMAATMNPIDSCTKIVAGAGCGKTKVISNRFLKLTLDLIKNGEAAVAEKILVITFTDKAANEMKERIYQSLEAGGVDYYSQNLWVSTFHGFCSKILRKHSIEVGLAPNFKLGSQKELREIYDKIIDKIRNSGFEGVLSIENIKHLDKIENIDTVFETIFEIIKKIKSLGLTPREFLKETFQSTKEFSRVVENLPFGFDSKEEYETNWAEHLRKYSDDFCKFDEAFKKIADAKLVVSKNGSSKAKMWGYGEKYPENVAEIEKAELYFAQVVAAIYELYENELKLNATADFDDLINKTILIFKNCPEIRKHYKNQFKHIIIDEFQDTNGAQLELIKLLLDENHANITFVGDRKQSIYGFRHARMENLEVLHKFIEAKYETKYPEITLNKNYRSTGEVLDAVNFLTSEFLNLDEKLLANFEQCDGKQVFRTVFCDIENSYSLKVKQAKFIADEIKKLNAPNYKDIAILVNSHSEAEFIEKFLLRADIPAIKKVNTGFFKSAVVKNLTALMRLAYNKFDEQAFVRVLKIRLSDRGIYDIVKIFENELRPEMEFEDYKKLNFAQKFFACKIENDIESVLKSIKQGEKISTVFHKLISGIQPFFALNEYDARQAQIDIRTFEKIIENYENERQFVYLGDFIKYLDEISNDIDFELPNIAGKNIDAVNILTTHASKGLEFDYVFCTYITSKTMRDSGGGAVFDLGYGDKGNFGIIANKFKGKDTPKALLYKHIWRNPRAENEKMRLFYVAISRAKKYLNIISFEQFKGAKPVHYCEVTTPTLV